MKALVADSFGPIEGLYLGQLKKPAPSSKEVLIRIQYAGVNFPDVLLVKGLYQFKPDPPFSPGGELAGIVEAVGADVTRFKKGDQVIAPSGWGGFAQFIALHEGQVSLLPDSIDLNTGSVLLETYATAYHALVDRAQLMQGERLVVLGAAGGTGTAAVQLGKALGAEVVAVASSDEKLNFCLESGADKTINYTESTLKSELKEMGGADVIFDPVGGSASEGAFRSLRFGGRHLVVGFASGQIPELPWNLPLLKASSVVGVFWGSFWRNFPDQQQKNTMHLFELLEQNLIQPRIQHILPLEKGTQALQMIANREVMGKIALSID